MQLDSRIHQMLAMIQDMVDNGQSAPLNAGKVMISRDEMSRAIEELTYLIDIEMKHYREVTDKRGKIISEAKKEAEEIIYEAEQSASRMRVKKSGNVSPIRVDEMSKEDRRALSHANEIYAASIIYTDELMKEVDDVVKSAYENIFKQYQMILGDMESKIKAIESNREELMADLAEMKKEDRYQQIVEISQLLSNELYYAKKKAKSDEEEERTQLELQFDQSVEAKEEPEASAEEDLDADMKVVGPDGSVTTKEEAPVPQIPMGAATFAGTPKIKITTSEEEIEVLSKRGAEILADIEAKDTEEKIEKI